MQMRPAQTEAVQQPAREYVLLEAIFGVVTDIDADTDNILSVVENISSVVNPCCSVVSSISTEVEEIESIVEASGLTSKIVRAQPRRHN